MGDFLAFTSGLMNDAVLGFQILLSVFFLANDLALCYQYYYYNSVYPRTYAPLEDEGTKRYSRLEPDTATAETAISEIHDPSSVAIHIKKSQTTIEPESETGSLSSSSGPSYDSVSDARGPGLMKSALAGAAIIGKASGMMTVSEVSAKGTNNLALFLAWGCTCFYVASRCPQLYKNYKRKSVDGISPLLFGAALGGNLTYTLCVLTSCDFGYAPDKHAFFMKQLPYILGSSGTIVFDMAYFYQRYIYRFSGASTSNMTLEDWDEITVRVSA